MNIKVQCGCGTKFAFDVEPAKGKMPVHIVCPNCGMDATELANASIRQTLTGTMEVPASTSAPRIRLHVAHREPVALEDTAHSAELAAPTIEMCHRHPRNGAVDHCAVCKKPICLECMQSFGHLCSVNCRYRAEQEQIKVPVYKNQRSVIQKAESRKTLLIAMLVAVILVGLAGAWFWYISVGAKPRPYYSLKLPRDQNDVHAQFLGPNQILLLGRKQVSLHDITSEKDVWSTSLEDSKPEVKAKRVSATQLANQGNDDSDFEFNDDSSLVADPFFNGDDLWICLAHRVVCLDLKNGGLKYSVPFQGRFWALTPGESAAIVVSEKEPTTKLVTQINLASGEATRSEVAAGAREKVSFSQDLPSSVAPTAALLLKEELEGQKRNQPSIYKTSSQFFPSGQNLVEMQVKLLEVRLATVQTIKSAGPSKLNSDTRASTSARALLEELSNEQKRNTTGGYRQIDESRYAVTLRRSLEKDAAAWTGEVVGVPAFFPQKTVDVLVAGKTLLLFDKQTKKIAESQLSFPLDEQFTGDRTEGRAPCVEHTDALFIFDKGVLTALELRSGNVKWRLTSVGINQIQFDEKGMLYVSSTTATPEDIQYSEQIKIMDTVEPLLLKVDPKSGKTLWKIQANGQCFLTGKYAYLAGVGGRGFSMASAVEDAFGVAFRGGGDLQIYRINPSNGEKMWSIAKKNTPLNIDFSKNRILLHYPGEIQIEKFISF